LSRAPAKERPRRPSSASCHFVIRGYFGALPDESVSGAGQIGGAIVKSVNLSRSGASSRRRFLGCAAGGLVALAFSTGAGAEGQTSFPVAELMAPGPLPDLPLGSADAKVTVIEYASMTCSHCAAFHETTWPALKAKYVDTGKVRFILREFPLDPLAAAAFMLARCAGPEKRNAIVDMLYTQQSAWAFDNKPLDALAGLVKIAGVSQADFDNCLKDQALYDKVNQARAHAAEAFKVNATPTFFVNGQELNGELPLAAFDKVIEPLLN
jgi:protein-disulfide isomerase